jgi:hypothetical protein
MVPFETILHFGLFVNRCLVNKECGFVSEISVFTMNIVTDFYYIYSGFILYFPMAWRFRRVKTIDAERKLL